MFDIITKLGGRRFILTLGAGIVTTLLLIHRDIDQSIYSTLILGTVAAYITANTVQKTLNNKYNGKDDTNV